MYIPKSKYRPPKYTQGNQFTLPDGLYYTGWYIETFKGEFLTGKTPTQSSMLLTNNIVSDEDTPEFRFTNDIIIPTEKDYSNGYMYRYFVQDKRTRAIIEATLAKYKYYTKQRYTQQIRVKWELTGPAENKNIGLYIFFGAASRNEEAIKQGETTIQGLSTIIKSYSEFVR